MATQSLPLIYAVNADGSQSAHLMRTYKRSRMATEQMRAQIVVLIAYAVQKHRRCMEGPIVGRQPMDGWTTVPSTRGRPGEHPIAVATREGRFAPGPHVNLVPGPNHGAPAHQLAVGRWVVDTPDVVRGRHVLVVDDTWTSGANAQSAAAAIRAAGATHVTILTVARWLNVDEYTKDFITTRLRGPRAVDFSPRICPVTGGQCPT